MTLKYPIYFFLLACFSILLGCETHHTYYEKSATVIDPNKRHYSLDLSFKSLRVLPNNLKEQTEIRRLNLSGNELLNIPETIKTVCNLPKLRVLILNKLQLQALPTAIQKCTSLTQLSLRENPELDFSKAFETLSALPLVFIDLSHNNLASLPSTLAKLQTLKDLRLSHNHISTNDTYAVLSRLPHLFSLWLDNNQLQILPKELGLLSSVEYLFLDQNFLRDVPQTIAEMPRLSSLWLAHNCFNEIPPILANSNIYMLFINDNYITQLGDIYKAGAFNLQGITLDNNYLSASEKALAEKVFAGTFIYSDSGQKTVYDETKCKKQTLVTGRLL